MSSNAPSLTYSICSTQRSGSTMLSGLLEQTGSLGRPREILNMTDIVIPMANEWGLVSDENTLDVRKYLAEYKRHFSTSNGVVAAKIHYYQLEPFLKSQAIAEFLLASKLILLIRKDLVAQAASLYVARATNEWVQFKAASSTNATPARQAVAFDLVEFTKCINIILWQLNRWLEFFAVNTLDYHVVTYEDVIDDPNAACEAISAYVGVSLLQGAALEQLRIERQADDLNLRLCEEFRRLSPMGIGGSSERVIGPINGLTIQG